MAIRTTVEGVSYVLETADDVVALHKALRRLVKPASAPSKPPSNPTGKKRSAAVATRPLPLEAVSSNGHGRAAVRQFFGILKEKAPEGPSTTDLIGRLHLAGAHGLAHFMKRVKDGLRERGLNYDDLVTRTRLLAADGERRFSRYSLTADGERQIGELLKGD